jgi:calcineurin-like phosphoesterase family protein
MIFSCHLVLAACVLLMACAVKAQGQSADPIGLLLAVGDISTCSDDPDRSGKSTADLIAKELSKAHAKNPKIPVRVLALGDLAYAHGTPKSFQCFDLQWGQFMGYMLPVPGNHEYDKKLGNRGASPKGTHHAKPYFQYFSKRLNELGGPNGYYFIDFPENSEKHWRLIGLNSNTETGAKSDQVKKLTEDLKKSNEGATKVRCVLAFSHAFFYSSGRHGHGQNDKIDLSKSLQPEKSMRPIFNALYEGGASVLLSGHDHHYEQLGRVSVTT